MAVEDRPLDERLRAYVARVGEKHAVVALATHPLTLFRCACGVPVTRAVYTHLATMLGQAEAALAAAPVTAPTLPSPRIITRRSAAKRAEAQGGAALHEEG